MTKLYMYAAAFWKTGHTRIQIWLWRNILYAL